MDKSSRTAKSLKNSIIAMLFFAANFLLSFYSRKILLEYLGTEILGLNTTAMNLLQFLNLAELGISAAVGFSLYKPILDNNQDAINEIVSLQKHLYRRIALLIIGGACLLMCFFPLIFKKITLPLWYAYASFGVLLFSALLGYFVNYKQVVLSASQQDYKILYSYRTVLLIKVVCQMLAVCILDNPYVWWLVLEALFAIIASWSLHRMTMSTFPVLRTVSASFNDLRIKYSELVIKIKQLFFHKIAAFALTQSSPIIIYAYTSLSEVALYGNYLIIMSGLQLLFTSIFNSINAAVGNLVADCNKEKQIDIFFELFSIRFLIVVVICSCTYILTPAFIKLWIGEQYILESSTLLLLLCILYINLFRFTVDSFVNAFGLYQDTWAPMAEMTLNISLSIGFGAIWGLNGVLTGVLCSLILLVVIWKPYFLFTQKFKGLYRVYIWIYLKHIIAATIALTTGVFLWKHLQLNTNLTFVTFTANMLIAGLLFTSLLTIALIALHTGIIQFLKRIIHNQH